MPRHQDSEKEEPSVVWEERKSLKIRDGLEPADPEGQRECHLKYRTETRRVTVQNLAWEAEGQEEMCYSFILFYPSRKSSVQR